MSSILVILFLCAGVLLANGQECKGSKVSAEIKNQIVDYHTKHREIHPIEWDCRLEEIARATMKGSEINTSKINKKRGVNVYEIRKEFETEKDLVNRALRRWWSSDLKSRKNMGNKDNKKFGCNIKNGSLWFWIVCVYEKFRLQRFAEFIDNSSCIHDE
ncbi:SCP-like protein [Ancylostoma duodenale]|uniref:SCP-like protein n=1 Tax=Ancylostoma duodenale TaxID=51022 RepID=A0A0C2GZG3_9BILA|nr:SCP-like protein [Ancylostoma duodenale]